MWNSDIETVLNSTGKVGVSDQGMFFTVFATVILQFKKINWRLIFKFGTALTQSNMVPDKH